MSNGPGGELTRALVLPEGAQVRAIETRLQDDTMHIRVCLQIGR